MNKQRRKAIEKLSERLEALKSDVETIQMEEQDYFDAMPENFQSTERGEAAEAAIYALDEAIDNIDSAMSSLEEATAN